MRYLLDTNAITRAVREPTGRVAQQVDRHPSQVFTNVIVESEIRFGIAKRPDSKVVGRLARCLKALEILPFDSEAAAHYGEIRAELERRGNGFDAMETLIAATVVTDNSGHFTRAPGLLWENWEWPENAATLPD